WPFRTAFWISRPALDRLAKKKMGEPLQGYCQNGQAGLFRLKNVYALPDEFGFIAEGTNLRFVYAPKGRPWDKDLGNSWYVFTESGLDQGTEVEENRDRTLAALEEGEVVSVDSADGVIESLRNRPAAF